MSVFLTLPVVAQTTGTAIAHSALTSDSIIAGVGFGIISFLIAIVGFFSKRQLDTILSTITKFTEKQSICREELSSRFADKAATAIDLKELYIRTDRHEACLQRHSVMLGGRRVGDSVIKHDND